VREWVLVSIPIIAAVVGWFTNLLALKMTFYPLEFLGVELPIKMIGIDIKPHIGWQGIIPSKAEKMAGKAVDLITSKLIDVKAQFAHIDPKVVAREMEPVLDRLTRTIIDESMTKHIPLIWNMTPKRQKEKIYESAAKEFPLVTEEIMEDIKENIVELFDLKGMVTKELTKDKALLNRIFLEVGSKEFKFIEQSGFYFGFIFGLVQMVIWYYLRDYSWSWIILPIGGLIVGWLTNVLALRMIFEPETPRRWLFIKVQGLFIMRQKEVSAAYAKLIANNILTMPNIFETLLQGQSTDKLVKIVEKHVHEGVDKTAGFTSSLIIFTSGTATYDSIKETACQRFMEELPEHIRLIFDYAEEALDIEDTLRDKMQSLSPPDFVSFLRPVFQEDEWKLILVGAILGGLAGLLQLFTV
jgi:uncharacterized membrane protein YheB (UPF0754 family)